MRPPFVFNGFLTPSNVQIPFTPPTAEFVAQVLSLRNYTVNLDQSLSHPGRKKLDNKAKEGIFIGYDDTSAAYKIYHPKERKISKSIDVIFNEKEPNLPVPLCRLAFGGAGNALASLFRD
jgi:hypothetical protein